MRRSLVPYYGDMFAAQITTLRYNSLTLPAGHATPLRRRTKSGCALKFIMTILPWAILSYSSFVHASLPPVVLNSTRISTLDTCDISSTSGSRTLWNIIWSCSVTLSAWTWTAIHPNIAGQNDSKYAIIGRRLFLMVLALFAPELLVTWAALQYFSARETVQEFNTIFLPRINTARATISDLLCMWLKPWQSDETKSPLGRLDA